MGRHDYDDPDVFDGLRRIFWFLLFLAVAAFVFRGGLFALAVYGVPLFILAGTISSEIYVQLKFEDPSHDEPLSAVEHDLSLLKAEQHDLRVHKSRIYQHGDRLGLERRNSDGRFYDRGQGKVLNNQLAKLDKAFESSENKIFSLKEDATIASHRRYESVRHGRNRVAAVLAFRAGLGAYLGLASLLAVVDPWWAASLSGYIAPTIWLQSPTLENYYGPLSIASALAAAAIVGLYCAKSDRWQSVLNLEHLKWERDDNIEAFEAPEDVIEATDFDEEQDVSEDEEEQPAKEPSPYEVLGVSPGASRDEILGAYRELVKQYHPDFQQGRGPELKELAEHKTQLLNWAKDAALKMSRA